MPRSIVLWSFAMIKASEMFRWIARLPMPPLLVTLLLVCGSTLAIIGLVLISAETTRALRPVEIDVRRFEREDFDRIVHPDAVTSESQAYVMLQHATVHWGAAIAVNRGRKERRPRYLPSSWGSNSEYWRTYDPCVLVPLVGDPARLDDAFVSDSFINYGDTLFYLLMPYEGYYSAACEASPPGATSLISGWRDPPPGELVPLSTSMTNAISSERLKVAMQDRFRRRLSTPATQTAPIDSLNDPTGSSPSWLRHLSQTYSATDGLLRLVQPASDNCVQYFALAGKEYLLFDPSRILLFIPNQRPDSDELLARANYRPGIRTLYASAMLLALGALLAADHTLARWRRKVLGLVPDPRVERAIFESLASRSASAPPLRVTLVHGTWAPQTDWVKPGSRFRCELMTQLGVPVNYVAPTWSGWNQHFSRRAAAKKLAEAIQSRGRGAAPGGRHFVVGHSHGGNVAVIAAQNVDHVDRPAGVVCVATPFLHVKQLGVSQRRHRMVAAAIVASMIGVVWVTMSWLGVGEATWRVAGYTRGATGEITAVQHERVYKNANVFTLGLATVCAAAICAAGVAAISIAMRRYERLTRVSEWDVLSPPEDLPIVSVRHVADEATSGLYTLTLLNWGIDWLWDRCAFLCDMGVTLGGPVRRVIASAFAACISMLEASWGWLLAGGMLLVGMPSCIWLVLSVPLFATLLSVIGAMVLLSLIVAYGPYVAMAIVGLALLPLKLLSVVIMLPFGIDLALASLRYHVAVDSCLLGKSHSIVHPPVGFGDSDEMPTLAHLLCTDDLRVIESIAKWIKSKVPTTQEDVEPTACEGDHASRK